MKPSDDLTTSLSEADSVSALAAVVVREARRIASSQGAAFAVLDGDQCHYEDEDSIAPLWKGQRFPQTICISGWVMMHRTPAVVPDIRTDPRIPYNIYRLTYVRSLLMIPVRPEAPWAAIGVYFDRAGVPDDRITSAVVELAAKVADAWSDRVGRSCP